MDVRLPDGTVIQNVPDGTSKADLVTKLKNNGMAVPAEWLQPAPAPKSTAESIGDTLMGIPRQLGLTARYALEGPAQAAETFTEPIRNLVVNPIARLMQPTTTSDLVTGAQPVTASRLSTAASNFADWLGLPKPQGANERVIGDATRLGFGSIGLTGLTGKVAQVAQPGVAQNVLQQMAANPATQTVGAATAGAAGGSVREAGGSPLAQFGASLAGGVAGGMAAQKAPDAVNAIKALVTKPDLVQADNQINLVLNRSGIDWSQVPERIKQGMRDDVAKALNTGQDLNPDAIRRLYYFRATGTTPTVGMLTQDPSQITREMNLAKAGANSSDASLQKLPSLQNSNAAALLSRLDEAGAANAPGAFDAGQKTLNALQSVASREKGNIDSLYASARDTQGRSLPLEPGTFTRRANELLDQEMVGGALPPDVGNTLNKIAKGEMPLTVEIAEQLKTRIGKLQRATNDGTAKMALGLVRQALDETPLQGSVQVNPGNLPAVAGTVPPSTGTIGQESIDAFNSARKANAQWMSRVESNPALKAAVDGIEPDNFVQKFVIGKGATAADLQALKDEIAARSNPGNLPVVAGDVQPSSDAVQPLRQYIVKYLRDAATNSTDDITKFSNDAYRRALRNIGDQKLAVFFSPEEVANLKNVGEAAKYMQAQPVGSAVNNSNSAATLLGKGWDFLTNVAPAKLPLGLKDTISGSIQGWQQRQALTPKNALVLAADPSGRPVLNPLLAAALTAPVQARQDDRSR